jgi:hypothetical protein
MKLAITVDVEEEGLFSGAYPRVPPGSTNVAQLRRLEFIPREFGFPLTLLVSYQTALDPEACRVLADFQERHGAEIGAHLHPWSTPPYAELPWPEPVSCELLPDNLLRDKFATLVGQVRASLGVAPTSFRMGRFAWGPKAMALLPEFGFRVDSSFVPLSLIRCQAEDFLLPNDPFWLPGSHETSLLEAPLTLVPLVPGTNRAAFRFAKRWPRPWTLRLLRWYRYFGVAGIQPAWFPLASMVLAARLHRRRGGRALTMFFHSTELQPGASPLVPTGAAVDAFLGKIRSFLTILARQGPVEGVTLTDLGRIHRRPGERGRQQSSGSEAAGRKPGHSFCFSASGTDWDSTPDSE